MIGRLAFAFLLFAAPAFADYESVVAADAPCQWYKMQETTGTTLASTAGGGCGAKDVTTTGSPSLNQSSTGVLSKKSVNFNGSTQYAKYVEGLGGCPMSLSVGNWSWEIWSLVHGNGGDGTAIGIVLNSTAANGTKHAFRLYALARAGDPVGQMCVQNTINGAYSTPACVKSSLSSGVLDTWYHLAATWNLSTTTLKFYLNGVLGDTQTTTSGTAGCGEDIDIARLNFNGSSSTQLNGNVQYAAIYKSTLSGAQVLAHYNAGISLPATGQFPFTVKRDVERGLLPVSFGLSMPYWMKLQTLGNRTLPKFLGQYETH